MADRKTFNFICCVICILISVKNLRIDAEEFSPRLGTCDSEENEDSFCDSKDENVYLGNSDLKDHEKNLGSNEEEKILSQDLPEEKSELSTEDGNSLSEIDDKQIHITNNFTNEWLGLQIPIIDGVRVSITFLYSVNGLKFLLFSIETAIYFLNHHPKIY